MERLPAGGWSHTGLPPGFAIELARERDRPFDSITLRSAFMAACMLHGAGGESRAAVVGAWHSGQIVHFLRHPFPPAVELAERFYSERNGLLPLLKNCRAPVVYGFSFLAGASPYAALMGALSRMLGG